MAATQSGGGARWTVAVLGAGGVGGLVGALLRRAGHEVVFLGRPQTVPGPVLTVHSVQYGDLAVPAPVHQRLTGPVDVCLLATKATSLAQALDRVPAAALGAGLVVPLLNGLEHMALLRGRYPAGQVVAGAIRVESTRVGPRVIEHTSPFTRVQLASTTAPPARVRALAVRLGEAGIDTTVRDNEPAMLWEKLSFLAPLALLTTRYGATVGQVRRYRRAELRAVVDEIAGTAGAVGVVLDPAGIVAFVDQLPPDMQSSMRRDAQAGRPTELDAIGGAVLRAAGRAGVPVPVTARLVAELGPAGPDPAG